MVDPDFPIGKGGFFQPPAWESVNIQKKGITTYNYPTKRITIKVESIQSGHICDKFKLIPPLQMDKFITEPSAKLLHWGCTPSAQQPDVSGHVHLMHVIQM